jgi:hypothetical protein
MTSSSTPVSGAKARRTSMGFPLVLLISVALAAVVYLALDLFDSTYAFLAAYTV